jgi:hypothetical protein
MNGDGPACACPAPTTTKKLFERPQAKSFVLFRIAVFACRGHSQRSFSNALPESVTTDAFAIIPYCTLGDRPWSVCHQTD